MNSYKFNFPEDWDRDNVLATRQYEKCGPKFDNVDDFKFIYTRANFYHIMVWCLIAYNTLSLILLLINKNSVGALKLNKTLMIIYIFSSLICIINCYLRNIFYHTMPCSIVTYLYNLGYIPNILASIGCIMYYLQQCYITLNSYNKAINNHIVQSGFIYNVCLKFKEEKYIKFMLYCTLGSVLYSGVFGIFGRAYTYYPVSKGYCTTSGYEGYPILVFLAIYLVFSIFALIEFHRLGKDFYLRRAMTISLIIAILIVMLSVLGNSTEVVKCNNIIRYIPHDSLLQVFSSIYNFSQITLPICQLYYTRHEIKKLEVTKSGLIHLLNDNALFNEFLNFCNSKRCVEGVIFYREYKKFKNIYKVGSKRLTYAFDPLTSVYSSNSNSGSVSINVDTLIQNGVNTSGDSIPSLEASHEKDDNDPSDNEEMSTLKKNKRNLSIGRKKKEYVNIYSNENINNNSNSNFLTINSSNNNINSSFNSVNSMNTLHSNNSKSNLTFINNISNNNISSSNIYSNSNLNNSSYHLDKKVIQIYDMVHEKANSIYKFFFTRYSDYELNVPHPIVKKIHRRLKTFNHHYKRMKENQNFSHEELECEDLFDEAYEDVIQSLYLNTYSAFVLYKRRLK